MKSIGVFDSSGTFLSTFGDAGEGPGEFRGIRGLVVGPGDTLFVYDNALLRRTVYDADHRLVRTETLPGALRDAVMLPNGNTLVSGHVPSPERVGLPLHELGPGARLLRSYGAERAIYRPDYDYLAIRRIGQLSEGSVIAAHINKYQIDVFDGDGRRLRELRREVPWFEPWTSYARFGERPNSALSGVGVTTLGGTEYACVLVSVPDPQWTPPSAPGPRTQEQADRDFDTIFELIDPAEGTVVATQRFPERLPSLTNDCLLPVLRVDHAAGVVWIDVFRPTLVPRR